MTNPGTKTTGLFLLTVMFLALLATLLSGCKVSASETIELRAKNTYTFRGPVDEGSVAKAQSALIAMSQRLGASEPIYLVLDTPGGSVSDGRLLIDTIKGLPNKVHTVTLFAASMGFHIAQSLDTRYIISSGTLMSHRASGGISGEMPGSFNTRAAWILGVLAEMDHIAAKRMSKPLKVYQELIREEYWVHGSAAVANKAADSIALVRCNEDLMGNETVEVASFFGPFQLTFSKCPLIQGVLEAKPLGAGGGEDKTTGAGEDLRGKYVRTFYGDRTVFIPLTYTFTKQDALRIMSNSK